MLKEIQKNKIVASYSKVLTALVQKQQREPEKMVEEIESAIHGLGDIAKNEVSPLNYSAYKKAICAVNKTRDDNTDDNEIIKFLLFVLQRRYGFLLPNILEKTKHELQNKNGITKVDVYSKTYLNDKMKDNIKQVIEAQIENAKISFKNNSNISTNSIEFVANGKICVLNLQQITNKILNG